MRTALFKRLIIFAHDAVMVCVAWLTAYWLRFNLSTIPSSSMHSAENLLPAVLCAQILSFYAFGLYRGIWRFASIPDLMRILKAVSAGVVINFVLVFSLTGLDGVPRSVFPLYALLLVSLLCAPRFLLRWWRDQMGQSAHAARVLIVGAGGAGHSLARNLLQACPHSLCPLAFVDDDVQKQGIEIYGIRVVGRTRDIPELVRRLAIDRIFIAIPSAKSANMRQIVARCEQAGVPVSTLPSIADLAHGKVTVKALRDVSIEDLLGRDPVELDWQAIAGGIAAHRIVITGAGGSIGSELARLVASLLPEQLILIDHSEFNLYQIDYELRQKYPELNLSIHLANVTDRVAMQVIFDETQPQVVFHAAAYKHVPMLQAQIRSAVNNNVIGTQVVAEVAVAHRVERFVLISTDKAVNPTNIMGASKRVAEIFCQNYNAHVKTQFITVRFGNVLGSAGSVIPLFRRQLEQGGPLTVTHPEITRYFMTIPEASQLILQAAMMGVGGEIFVLDMGEPIQIRYLAEQMIRLSGKSVGEDIEIRYTGLRPGEKLFEELFLATEQLLPTSHHKILKAKHCQTDWQQLQTIIKHMQTSVTAYNESELLQLIQTLLPKFTNKPTLQSVVEEVS